MKLSLIAMSGSGKSYWSSKLAKHGFQHFDCDRMIAAKLGPALRRSDGTVSSLGKWMGLPNQPGYRERESEYLKHEKQVLQKICEAVASVSAMPESKIVIDTTGSVIYTGQGILNRLRQFTTVVYLAIPFEMKDQMLRAYRANPRPVLWQGAFVPKPHEKSADTLARCYPKLLAERERLYKRCAHVIIPYDEYRKSDWGVADFLDAINIRLQR